MSLVLSDPTNKQGLYEDVKFKSGKDGLSYEDFLRMLNFAVRSYSLLRLMANGRWRPDDSRHVDGSGNRTLSVATATLGAGDSRLPLDTDMLLVEQVLLDGDVLTPVDPRDYRGTTLTTIYGSTGTPRAYNVTAGALEFHPTPSTSHTITLIYGRAFKDYSTSDAVSTEISVPTIHHEYLSLKIRSQLNERSADKNADDVERKLMIEEARIKDFASIQDQDTPRRLKAKINVPK